MKTDQSQRGPSFYAAIGRLSAIVTVVPASMAAGWAVGHYVVDHFLGTAPWGSLLFILVGAGAGLYEAYVILVSSERRQNQRSPDDRS